MLKKIGSWISILTLGLALATPATALAAFNAKDEVCQGIGLTSNTGSGCDQPAGSKDLSDVVATAINLLSLLVGIIAVFAIIFGGFRYITSLGDSTKISSAKDTIVYAIIGLIVVASAQLIVRFVLNRAG